MANLQQPTILEIGPSLGPPQQPTNANSSAPTAIPPICGNSQNAVTIWDNVPCTTKVVPSLTLNDTEFDQDTISDGIITRYILETDYIFDEHVIQMPVMSTDTTSASFANLANETMKRIVYWSAEKANVPPTMPDPDLNNDNAVLLSKKFTPLSVELAPDGATPVYTLKGVYIYGIKDPSEETMYFGVPPYINIDYDQTEFGDFVGGIIDGEQTP